MAKRTHIVALAISIDTDEPVDPPGQWDWAELLETHPDDVVVLGVDEPPGPQMTLAVQTVRDTLALIDDMARFIGVMSLADYQRFNDVPRALREALGRFA